MKNEEKNKLSESIEILKFFLKNKLRVAVENENKEVVEDLNNSFHLLYDLEHKYIRNTNVELMKRHKEEMVGGN